jgi:hypothetical protein
MSTPTSGKREDIGPRRRHDDAVTSNRQARTTRFGEMVGDLSVV